MIPCDPDSGHPLFAASLTDGEIWPCLLEKAWAKVHLSYCMTRLGSPSIAITALTGGLPHKVIDHETLQLNNLIGKIQKCLNKKQRVLACEWDN